MSNGHSTKASKFPFINSLEILGCATNRDSLLLATLWYVQHIDHDFIHFVPLIFIYSSLFERSKNNYKYLVSPQEHFEKAISHSINLNNLHNYLCTLKNERDTNKVHYGRAVMYSPAELMGQKRHKMLSKSCYFGCIKIFLLGYEK